ncbi:MAG TPA: adenylate/guanylate cyclase domain-containing protein [Candidatus Limnocylindrales bacterium]|nr:adenylate/guanylate cyclase domain-containing protein [Candidatus Limnocylindrales bacterium]
MKGPGRARALVDRVIGIADQLTDDDDLRLRKRVVVIAGYILVVGPLQLPFLSQGHPLSWYVAVLMPLGSAINLVVLARTKRLERYVHVLILSVLLAPAVVEVSLGGLAGASAAVVFAFLGPVFALLGLGPRRATASFVAFLVVLVGVVALDPLVSSRIPPQPYPMRLVWYVANLAVPLGITFALLRYTDVRRRRAEARSQELLTNAIPRSIAARLQRGEARIAESYPETTVLFADLAAFTPWARQTDPAHVVGFLDELFTRFDALAADAGVEKIKTIGDAYMAVAGAPEPRPDHAQAGITLALGMLEALDEVCRRLRAPLQLRIGLASGPVVGGVIGERRILFDLWGDTVNTAARMQSSGVPGRIHVAQSTRALLGDAYEFDEREPVDVKGLGPMTTYLLAAPVRGRQP